MRLIRRIATATLAATLLCIFTVAASDAQVLKYGDQQADGKQSLGSSGEMIRFTLPDAAQKVRGLRIHGARYGYPEAPDEDFLIFFLNDDRSDIVNAQMVPYSTFKRGANDWVEVTFKRPISVPKQFWVALEFRAHRTKGVYVSYDNETAGQYSLAGLPGQKPEKVQGDWMIQVVLGDDKQNSR